MNLPAHIAPALLCLLLTVVVSAQTPPTTKPDSEAEDQQKRLFVMSLVTSLAEEATASKDAELKPKILARAADVLWEADQSAARTLFKRAWDAAEVAHVDFTKRRSEIGRMSATMALMMSAHGDVRSEVLGLVVKRDRALFQEFLQKLQDATKSTLENLKTDAGVRNARDNWTGQEASLARFPIAQSLLNNGEVETALEVAGPVLNQVNAISIGFLSALREKNPALADQKFVEMLRRAEVDPASDANTASGLSSYAFTPNLYVTFDAGGGASWGQTGSGGFVPPNLSPAVLDRFFRTAASILFRPLPPPDQDQSSSGVIGKYMVLKRLLPLFDRYAPDLAPSLRAQTIALETMVPKNATNDDHHLAKLARQDIAPKETPNDIMKKMQERLDRAKTTAARDEILMETALALVDQLDSRARTIADRIDDKDRRLELRRFIDFEFLQQAVKKKDSAEVVRLTRAGELTRVARVWGYTRGARLLIELKRSDEAFELLEEAAAEARRMDADDPDRARSLISVAMNFMTGNKVRAWEVVGEAVKAANAADRFNAEHRLIVSKVNTRPGWKTRTVPVDDFTLTRVMRALMEDDLHRATDLAKSLSSLEPRALAILAIAHEGLKKAEVER